MNLIGQILIGLSLVLIIGAVLMYYSGQDDLRALQAQRNMGANIGSAVAGNAGSMVGSAVVGLSSEHQAKLNHAQQKINGAGTQGLIGLAMGFAGFMMYQSSSRKTKKRERS